MFELVYCIYSHDKCTIMEMGMYQKELPSKPSIFKLICALNQNLGATYSKCSIFHLILCHRHTKKLGATILQVMKTKI